MGFKCPATYKMGWDEVISLHLLMVHGLHCDDSCQEPHTLHSSSLKKKETQENRSIVVVVDTPWTHAWRSHARNQKECAVCLSEWHGIYTLY